MTLNLAPLSCIIVFTVGQKFPEFDLEACVSRESAEKQVGHSHGPDQVALRATSIVYPEEMNLVPAVG